MKVFPNVDEMPLISIFGKLIYISIETGPKHRRDIKMFIKRDYVVDFIMVFVLNFYLRKGFIMPK